MKNTDIQTMIKAFEYLFAQSDVFTEIFTEDVLISYYKKMNKENAIDMDGYNSYGVFVKYPHLLTENVHQAIEETGLLSDNHWLKGALELT